MSHVTRKPVFGMCDRVRLKPACSATESSESFEILDIASIAIMQRTIKALIRLRGCVGWSAPLLFAHGINRFSHDVAPLPLHWGVLTFDAITTRGIYGLKLYTHSDCMWKILILLENRLGSLPLSPQLLNLARSKRGYIILKSRKVQPTNYQRKKLPWRDKNPT